MIPYLLFVLFATQAATAPAATPPDPATCPMHAQHMKQVASNDADHGSGVDNRHDSFGMAHDAVRHSFRLLRTGGVIELQTIETDEKAMTAIREHLRSVANDFTAGDFEKPLFVHGHKPDGVEIMAQRRDTIHYTFHELPRGGEVRIRTNDAEALAAIHQFLRFQITEHRTGDSGTIEEEK